MHACMHSPNYAFTTDGRRKLLSGARGAVGAVPAAAADLPQAEVVAVTGVPALHYTRGVAHDSLSAVVVAGEGLRLSVRDVVARGAFCVVCVDRCRVLGGGGS